MLSSAIYTLREESLRLRARADQLDYIITQLEVMDNPFLSDLPLTSLGIELPTLGTINVQTSTPPSGPTTQLTAPLKQERDLEGKGYREVCHAILKDSPRPLSKKVIWMKAVERGAKIPLPSNLASTLSRNKQFKTFGRGLWGLSSPP